MDLSPLSPEIVALLLVAVGVGLAVWGVHALSLRRVEEAYGRLAAIDAGRPAELRSDRLQIRGRPDALRQARDGRLLPVELKSRARPANGPARSHMVQVWAYCLLVEETTGQSPPFGVLRYSDQEYRITWDGAARREILALRTEMARPYDGRATPSVARCARCTWVRVCDARVVRN